MRDSLFYLDDGWERSSLEVVVVGWWVDWRNVELLVGKLKKLIFENGAKLHTCPQISIELPAGLWRIPGFELLLSKTQTGRHSVNQLKKEKDKHKHCVKFRCIFLPCEGFDKHPLKNKTEKNLKDEQNEFCELCEINIQLLSARSQTFCQRTFNCLYLIWSTVNRKQFSQHHPIFSR